VTYNQDFQKKGEELIEKGFVEKGGRVATREELMHLRNARGDLVPKQIYISDKSFVLVKPLTLGELNENFEGLVWGEKVNVGLKALISLLAKHIILEDGTALNENDMLDAFGMTDLTTLIDKWFEMSGLKPDEETMKRARELGVTVTTSPNSK
jgi:hypothetical protein